MGGKIPLSFPLPYFFDWERERDRNGRERERDRDIRDHGNGQIWVGILRKWDGNRNFDRDIHVNIQRLKSAKEDYALHK